MADSTCVLHPFSYPKPPFSNDTHEKKGTKNWQENPMYGFGESVSFGRYVSEELEWEKWSSFDSSNNRNRYVKEAEKYSKPGSVAQKKAYFEAHFKRMSALKAAALLEQANAVENCSIEGNDFEEAINNEKEVEKYDDKAEFVVHQNELYFNCVGDEENPTPNEIEGKTVGDPTTVVNPKLPDKSEVHSAFLKIDDCKASKEQTPLLQENCSKNKEKSAAAVTKNNNPPISPPRSTNVIHPGKENYATPIKKSSATDPDKKRTPLRVSINRELNRIISPVIKKLGSSSTPAKVFVSTPQPPPPMTPDLTRRGASPSSSGSRNKIRSPIIPNSFCRTGDRTARRKQKLEDKFNATATEKPPQPSKFKIKAEAELNKFRQSFCFKAMSSPDYYEENETFRSPKQKSEFVKCKSLRGRQSNRTISSQNSTSALPPRKPGLK